jgi:hypothetical protein
MRTSFFLAVALFLSLLADAANARAFDAKALARYDASYVKCEAQYPEMKGHGDEAYLNLWRMKAEPKYVAELTKLRRSPVYTAEKQRALRAPLPSASASTSLSHECVGLWGEYQRNAALKH